MISSLRGPVLSVGAGWVVVAVGGLGLRAEVPSARMPQLLVDDEVFLHTSLIVREDSLTLYGFSTEEELLVFGQLITVSGVGPRSALGVLAALSPAQIIRAVTHEEPKLFQQVPGIGPKTAKLLVVSLAGKLKAVTFAPATLAEAEVADPHAEVVRVVEQGLAGLGWSESDAATAVQDARSAGAPLEQAALLRAALALLQAPKATRGGKR